MQKALIIKEEIHIMLDHVALCTSIQRLIAKIHKESYNLVSEKQLNKEWARDFL